MEVKNGIGECPVIMVKLEHCTQNYFSLIIVLENHISALRTVPTIVIAHTFCASPDTRISYRQCLLIQRYFCAV